MEIAFRSVTELPDLPPQLMVAGKAVPIRVHSPTVIICDVPSGVLGSHITAMVSLMMGIDLIEMSSLPGAFDAQPEKAVEEVTRLMEEQDKELEYLRKIPEPQLEINIADPQLEAMVPTGKKIWDSVFVKLPPVIDLQRWLLGREADEVVYLPNDASRRPSEAEEIGSNGMYTEVLTNAYRAMCIKEGINPEILLQNGQRIQAKKVTPIQGVQHTVEGNVSGRLANSKLIDFDDSEYAKSFIECICDLKEWEFERETVRRRVLAKVEYILMGRTSHTYNQRLIHAMYNRFVVDVEDEDPWAQHRVPVTNSIMAILKQLVVEGAVLEDSKEVFLQRMRAVGFASYEAAISLAFDRARTKYGPQ